MHGSHGLLFEHVHISEFKVAQAKKKKVYFSFLLRDKNISTQNTNNKETRSFHRLVLRQNNTKHNSWVGNFIHLFKAHFYKHRSATSNKRIKTVDASSTEKKSISDHYVHCEYWQDAVSTNRSSLTWPASPGTLTQTFPSQVLWQGFPDGPKVRVVALSPNHLFGLISGLTFSCPWMDLALVHPLSCVWGCWQMLLPAPGSAGPAYVLRVSLHPGWWGHRLCWSPLWLLVHPSLGSSSTATNLWQTGQKIIEITAR